MIQIQRKVFWIFLLFCWISYQYVQQFLLEDIKSENVWNIGFMFRNQLQVAFVSYDSPFYVASNFSCLHVTFKTVVYRNGLWSWSWAIVAICQCFSTYKQVLRKSNLAWRLLWKSYIHLGIQVSFKYNFNMLIQE